LTLLNLMNSTVFLLYFLNDFDFKAFDLYPSLSKTNILHILVIELQPFHLWKLTRLSCSHQKNISVFLNFFFKYLIKSIVRLDFTMSSKH